MFEQPHRDITLQSPILSCILFYSDNVDTLMQFFNKKPGYFTPAVERLIALIALSSAISMTL